MYKRQAEAFIQYLQSHGENNKEAIFDCDVFGRKLGDLINEGMRVKLASMNETACIRAVSYTHLDVYKRQYINGAIIL